MKRIGSLVLLAMMGSWLSAAEPAPGDNWPQWRGPLAIGIAPAANPPLTWSEQTNIKWKVKLPGNGTATPIVWGDRIFIQTAIPTGKQGDAAPAQPQSAAPANAGRQGRGGGGLSVATKEIHQFVLMCLDRQTGKTLWQKVLREEVPHEGHHPTSSFASQSPVTDGKNIYAFFGSRGLHCLDMDGNIKWQKDLGRLKIKMAFGEGASPALYGNAIIVNWDHEAGSFIIAFDKETGQELWKQPREEETSWATPLVVEQGDAVQIITSASKKIRSYDLKTGKLLWECTGMTANVIPTPVIGDGILYATSGYRGNALLAIRLGRTGDLTGTDAILWRYGKNTPYVPSPLLCNGRVYILSGNNPVLTCLDAKDGRVLIDAQKVDGLEGVYASPVGSKDRVYLVGRNGATVVLKCSDKLEVLATNQLSDPIDASPVLVGKDLLLRGKGSLYCIGEK